MQRPALLVLPVVVLSAVIVQLRTIHAYESVRDGIGLDLVALTELSRLSWSLTAAVGLSAVGYAYGTQARSEPRRVLGLAALAALIGTLVGNVALWLSADVSWDGELVSTPALFGLYGLLDALIFGLIVVGGYAVTLDAQSRRSR